MEKIYIIGQDDSHKELLLPMMTLREVVMFPGSIIPLFVGRKMSVKAIESALSDYDKKIFLVAQKNPKIEEPGGGDIYSIGSSDLQA